MIRIHDLNSFKRFVFEKEGDKYTVLGNFINVSEKILIIHNECGHKYYIAPKKFRDGRRCPKCAKKIRSLKIHEKTRKNIDDFKKEVFNLVGNEYTILSDKYINNKTPLLFKHNVCGNIYYKEPLGFIKGQRCKYCYKKSKMKTTDDFKKDLLKFLGCEYELMSEYNGYQNPVIVRHNVCSHIFEIIPNSLTQNKARGCKFCNMSNGERKIKEYLEEKNIPYTYQFTFEDCKNKYKLPFDFKIDLNNKIILIEYDGEFHEKPFNNSRKSLYKFNNQKTNDLIKDDYCNTHNITLIRINYKEFNNISKILNESLK